MPLSGTKISSSASTEPVSQTTEHGAERAGEHPVDLVHLARVTFGDRELERELLGIFRQQANTLVQRINNNEISDAECAVLAHTLKGSALGIGAWSVARSADLLGQASTRDPDSRAMMLQRLAGAVAETDRYIRDLLPSP